MMADTNRITTPCGAQPTASEVLEGIDLSGRRRIVTAASPGIGVETARALAGAEVNLPVRSTDADEAPRPTSPERPATPGSPSRAARQKPDGRGDEEAVPPPEAGDCQEGACDKGLGRSDGDHDETRSSRDLEDRRIFTIEKSPP